MQQNSQCHSLTKTNETLHNNYGQKFLWIETAQTEKNSNNYFTLVAHLI